MVAAMVGEKAFQIDFVDALLVWLEADGAKQGIVGILAAEIRAVNAAKINKIQRSASHDKHGFKVAAFRVFGGSVGDLG